MIESTLLSDFGATYCGELQFAGSAPGGSAQLKLTTAWQALLFGSAPWGEVQNTAYSAEVPTVHLAPLMSASA
jgi:hypothetical protein